MWAGGYQTPANNPTATAGWTWVNGEGSFPGVTSASPYAHWASGEPNDAYRGEAPEQYLGLNFNNSDWNDEAALQNIYGYVIKYRPGYHQRGCARAGQPDAPRRRRRFSGSSTPSVVAVDAVEFKRPLPSSSRLLLPRPPCRRPRDLNRRLLLFLQFLLAQLLQFLEFEVVRAVKLVASRRCRASSAAAPTSTACRAPSDRPPSLPRSGSSSTGACSVRSRGAHRCGTSRWAGCTCARRSRWIQRPACRRPSASCCCRERTGSGSFGSQRPSR